MLPRSIDAAKINRCLLCSLFEEIFLLYFFRDTRTGKYWLLKKIIPNLKKNSIAVYILVLKYITIQESLVKNLGKSGPYMERQHGNQYEMDQEFVKKRDSNVKIPLQSNK